MYKSLLLTMLLGGLWHGASWMFVIWGGLHGLYLVIEKNLEQKVTLSRIPGYSTIVFIFVCLAWIFFRSHNLDFAIHTFKSCLMLNGFESFSDKSYASFGLALPGFIKFLGGIKLLIALLACYIFVKKSPNVFQLKEYNHTKYSAFLVAVVLFICIINLEKPSPFIYFQF
jgi:hypothetical protein